MSSSKSATALPVIPSNRGEDLHNIGIINSADLVLFMAGNQFMVMEKLLEDFHKRYPEVENIYYETLPPGLELKQILAGGAIFGDKILDVSPDVYASVDIGAMERLEQAGFISKGDYFLYLHNRLVLMIAKGNPMQISSISDLGREEVKISQPNREYEDIARYIIEMYRQAGGQELVNRIMEMKRAEGTTIMTVVHHRETPLRLMKKTVDVGPVWATEIVHAKESGLAVEDVEPGEELDQRDNVDYYICQLKNASHPENAEKFLQFIASARAQAIYADYGFVPHFSSS